MKKIFAIFAAVMIMLSMSVAAFATEVGDDGYIVSPGHKPGDTDEDIIITHYDDIDDAHPEVDRDDFQDAYDELKNADDLKDLNEDIKDGAVVRDLYDITLVDDAKKEFEENGKITVTFDTGFTDDNFQIIQRTENGWEIITGTLNPDGSVTVVLTNLGQVAFLTVPAEGGVDGPQTSDPMFAILVCLAAAGVAGAVVVYCRRKLAK